MTLTPENKSAWLAALRSGEYEQGRRALCKSNTYCCLGVYYDACVDSYWLGGVHGVWETTDGSVGVLSERYGLSMGMQSILANMNDSGKSFAEIADWIEANL